MDKGQGINVGSKDLEAIFENGSDTNVEKLLSLENPFNLFEIPNQVLFESVSENSFQTWTLRSGAIYMW